MVGPSSEDPNEEQLWTWSRGQSQNYNSRAHCALVIINWFNEQALQRSILGLACRRQSGVLNKFPPVPVLTVWKTCLLTFSTGSKVLEKMEGKLGDSLNSKDSLLFQIHPLSGLWKIYIPPYTFNEVEWSEKGGSKVEKDRGKSFEAGFFSYTFRARSSERWRIPFQENEIQNTNAG